VEANAASVGPKIRPSVFTLPLPPQMQSPFRLFQCEWKGRSHQPALAEQIKMEMQNQRHEVCLNYIGSNSGASIRWPSIFKS